MNNFLLYTITVVAWGSTWLAINYQLGTVPVEVSLAYRYFLASALMFAWCLIGRRRMKFGPAAHLYFFGLGTLLFGLNYIAAYHAQFYITSALNAVAFSSMVWMNIINARLFFGTRAGMRVYVGALCGIAGIVVLFLPELMNVEASTVTWTGVAFSLGGALCASFGNMASQYGQARSLPVASSNAWGMFYGALLLSGIALLRGEAFVFDTSPAYVISLLYLAVFGTVVAFTAYLTLLGRIGSQRAGYIAVMFPVVAVVLSWFFEGLQIDSNIIGGVALVLVGNVLILTRGRRAVPAA